MTDRSNIVATFARHADAHMVLMDMGHAYGKARFTTRRDIFGCPVNEGKAVRRVTIATRDGRKLEGYIENDTTFAALNFAGDTGDGSPSFSRYQLGTGAELAELVADLPLGAVVEALYRGDFEPTRKSWHRDAFLKTWISKGYNKSSPKQLASSLRRSSKVFAYRITLPRS